MPAGESKVPRDRKDKARYGAVFLEYAGAITKRKCNQYLDRIDRRAHKQSVRR